MSLEQRLIDAVLAAPQDDEPRIIYADWLDTRGDADRAAFIRAQLAQANCRPWERRAADAANRTHGLLMQHGERWRKALPELAGVTWGGFERGFVSEVTVPDAATLVRHAQAIRAAAPVVRVAMPHNQGESVDVPALPWLETLKLVLSEDDEPEGSETTLALLHQVPELVLILKGEYADPGWLYEAALPNLRVVRALGTHTLGRPFAAWLAGPAGAPLHELGGGTAFIDYNSGYFDDPTMGEPGARLLARATHLQEVRILDLSRQRIGNDGLSMLAALRAVEELHVRGIEATVVPHLGEAGRLLSIDLSHNAIGDTGAAALAGAPRARSLAALDLAQCEIGATGLEALVSAPFWHTLARLDLSQNPLGNGGMAALATADRPAALHTLVLADCDITDAATDFPKWIGALVDLDLSNNAVASQLQGLLGDRSELERLSLRGIGLTAKTAGALAAITETLTTLNLAGNPLGDKGLQSIFASTAPRLEVLDLSKTKVRAPGLVQMVSNLPKLRMLSLKHTAMSAGDLAALLDAPWSSPLCGLDLSDCELTDAAMDVLIHSYHFKTLHTLNLRRNAFTQDGFVALAHAVEARAIPVLSLTANPWRFPREVQALLQERFGTTWHWDEDEDEDDG